MRKYFLKEKTNQERKTHATFDFFKKMPQVIKSFEQNNCVKVKPKLNDKQ